MTQLLKLPSCPLNRCRKFLREVPEHVALQAIDEFMAAERHNIRKVSAYFMVRCYWLFAICFHVHKAVSHYLCSTCCMRGARLWYVLSARGRIVICDVCAGQDCGMCCMREARLWYMLYARARSSMCYMREARLWGVLYAQGKAAVRDVCAGQDCGVQYARGKTMVCAVYAGQGYSMCCMRGTGLVCAICAGRDCGMCRTRGAGRLCVRYARGRAVVCAVCAGQDCADLVLSEYASHAAAGDTRCLIYQFP